MARLAALRMMAGLSAKDVARRLNLKLREYIQMERGEVQPSPSHLEGLAHIYDIPLASLTEGPLPVPLAHGRPLTVEDELVDAYLDALTAIERLDRFRQAVGEKWSDHLREYALPHVPMPFPRTALPVVAPTALYLELPHTIYLATANEVTVARKGKAPITLRRSMRVLLQPGMFTFAPVHAGKTATIRIKAVGPGRIRHDLEY